MSEPRHAKWRMASRDGVWVSRDYWYARLNGWRLHVEEIMVDASRPTGRWYIFAERGDEVFNSAWDEVRRYWRSKEAAQLIAERGAQEGWDFLKPRPGGVAEPRREDP